MSAARPRMKPCGQWWRKTQWVDIPCPHPKFVPGRPNLSHLGAPLYAAVNPSRPQLCPGCPKYSTAWPAAQPLAENSPTSSSTTLLGDGAGRMHNGANETSLPDSCCKCKGFTNVCPIPSPYLICHAKTSSPTRYPSFCRFLYFSQAGPIQTCSSGYRHTLFPAKVAICCRRVLGCPPLPGLRGRRAGWDVILPVV